MFTERLLSDAANCSLSLTSIAKLHSALSRDIHGRLWYGPTVLFYIDDIEDEAMACFVKRFVEGMGFEISEVRGDGDMRVI